MRTMHPVVLHGYTQLDSTYLPVEEFAERLENVQKMMVRHELDVLIVYGSVRDYSELCYLTNYIPKHSHALILIPAKGQPCLLAGVAGTRDIPAVQALTWLEDIRSTKKLKAEISSFLENITVGKANAAIGICNKDIMRASLYQDIVDACQTNEFKDMDEFFRQILEQKRPREVSTMEAASEILRLAVEELKIVYRNSGDIIAAVTEAERVARLKGAQDVRLLFSLDEGKTLRPFEELVGKVHTHTAIAYMAVEFLGYWAEGFVTIANENPYIYQKATELLFYLKTSLQKDVPIADIVRGADQKIAPYSLHPLVQGGYGHAIGLSISETPVIQTSSAVEKVKTGSIYSIHAGLTNQNDENVILSALVLVEEDGSVILWSSI
ncbi:aminopeptidase P family N-terminal domain-containing protein [Bacillus sp. Marseille-P3661]|uniref:aminopeptidase P family N-terminal domain-containing protein n=1 Tax=Bacillus sp. Marseille-P3661 TaxID=1936234 RepID=UPI000C839229|nr:aminopeptidase P family N-terminal domain-containing protein [Bacillus sp. Marseille-P3661]